MWLSSRTERPSEKTQRQKTSFAHIITVWYYIEMSFLIDFQNRILLVITKTRIGSNVFRLHGTLGWTWGFEKIGLKRVSTSFTSLSKNVRSDTLLLPLYVIFLKSASTQHGSCSGSRELVLREHNLGSPEHNLGSPGTQSRFYGNTI